MRALRVVQCVIGPTKVAEPKKSAARVHWSRTGSRGQIGHRLSGNRGHIAPEQCTTSKRLRDWELKLAICFLGAAVVIAVMA